MPVQSGHVPAEEPKFPTLPAEVYNVVIEDVELDVKPNAFKKTPEDGQPETREQYKLKMRVTAPAEYADRLINCWVSTSLRVSTKSKRPGLPAFLKAVTGQDFTVEDRLKVTGDFMNSLIGSKLRVATQVEKSKTGTEFPAVTGFLVAR